MPALDAAVAFCMHLECSKRMTFACYQLHYCFAAGLIAQAPHCLHEGFNFLHETLSTMHVGRQLFG